MPNLTKAHEQLYLRCPDETFSSLQSLWEHCQQERADALTRWHPPQEFFVQPDEGRLSLMIRDDPFDLNEWSFSQLCRMAGVHKETMNRLTADTACTVFTETWPQTNKPMQLYTVCHGLRSAHGAVYTRLHNADLLSIVSEFVTGFTAPQEAANRGTGLYCGEQDMFCFLIDPTGWIEINDQAFAPGFFLWNSEVGRRSMGLQTFWFQKVCANHIVWDATHVVEYTRKHTANVHESLDTVRRMLTDLNDMRDARRDSFAEVIRKAMTTRLERDDDEALELVMSHGVRRTLAQRAIDRAQATGALTVYSVVDALTRLSQEIPNAGDRTDTDIAASSLLELVA